MRIWGKILFICYSTIYIGKGTICIKLVCISYVSRVIKFHRNDYTSRKLIFGNIYNLARAGIDRNAPFVIIIYIPNFCVLFK